MDRTVSVLTTENRIMFQFQTHTQRLMSKMRWIVYEVPNISPQLIFCQASGSLA